MPTDQESLKCENSEVRETSFEIFNTVTDAIYILDLSFTFIDVNKGATEMYQLSREEMIGKNPGDIAAEGMNDLQTVIDQLQSVVKTGKTERFEFWATRKNGELFPKDVVVNKGHYFGQEVLIATARDISEKKNAENRIKTISENWDNTFNAIEQGIALLDTEHNVLQSNKAFKGFVKKSDAEINGENCFHLVHGTAVPVEGCPFVRLKETLKREKMELTIGSSTFEITVDPIFDENQKLSGAVHIMADISIRKSQEKIKRIQYNIAHAVATTDTIGDLLAVVQRELGKIMDASNFFMAFYKEETNTLHSPFFSDLHDDFSEWPADQSISGLVVKEKKPKLISRGAYVDLLKEHNIVGAGTVAESWLGVPLMNGDDVFGVFVVQSYDDPNAYDQASIHILEIIANQLSVYIQKKNREEELLIAKNKAEESDRLKSAFLANMSHEIRTPMNSIMGFIDLLQEDDLPAEQQELYFDVLKKSGIRLLGTINDIIEISRIEAGQSSNKLSVVNLNETLEYISQVFDPESTAKGIKLTISSKIDKGKMLITTDKNKLESILTNLVKNAVKFTEKGSIDISCVLSGSKILFAVSDSGPGIPPDQLHLIFDRFVQANNSLSRTYEGSGLGLSIARAYTNMLGGEITCESVVGKGTTFSFTINYDPFELPVRI